MSAARPLGVVLAGGAGRRMGAAKTLVDLAGRPLLQYPVDALAGAVGEVVVACKQGTPLPQLTGVRAVWREPEQPRHPLAGVAAALRRARRAVLVCAGDMPLVCDDVLGRLLDAAGSGAAAVVPRAGGRVQPLVAIYQPAALDALESMAPDEPATEVVARLAPRVVEIAGTDAFANVNTPADLERAGALLAARG